MLDISAAIVTYKNDRKILLDAIESFLATDLSVILFIIDNSPTDSLRDLISDERVVYIFNEANLGFGKAHNIAIKKIQGLSKYHLVLNPDIFFKPNNLEKLFMFMEQNPSVGHVMPRVLYPDGSLQYLCKRNPTPFDLFARRFLPGVVRRAFKDRLDQYEYRDQDYSNTMFDIPYLSGCFMFVRNEIFSKVGLFDERIFMYIEDADLTRRILKVSSTAYFPEAEVYHHFAKGSHKSWKLTWYSIHGALIYFSKWGWSNKNGK